jgi:exosortase/archaeosortase family protein
MARRPSYKRRVSRFYLDEAKAFFVGKLPIFYFIAKFLALRVVYSAVSLLPSYQQFESRSAAAEAHISGTILHLVDSRVHVEHANMLSGQTGIITVLPTCGSIPVIWIFCSAIIAFPASWKQRITGTILGACAIYALNIIRIVSLYLVGVHASDYMQFVHESLWAIPFNLLSFALIIGWALWTRRHNTDNHARI